MGKQTGALKVHWRPDPGTEILCQPQANAVRSDSETTAVQAAFKDFIGFEAVSDVKTQSQKERPHGGHELGGFTGARPRWMEGNWKGMFVWFPTVPTIPGQGESDHCLGRTVGLFIFLGPALFKVSLSFSSTLKLWPQEMA